MTEDQVMQIAADAIRTTVMLAGPLLLTAMLIGVVVSILQAITQINEATLTFIPKMVAVIAVLAVMAPWMLEVLQTYAADIFGRAGEWVK